MISYATMISYALAGKYDNYKRILQRVTEINMLHCNCSHNTICMYIRVYDISKNVHTSMYTFLNDFPSHYLYKLILENKITF